MNLPDYRNLNLQCGPTITSLNYNFRVWLPPPRLTVSEWAEKHRILSSESSARAGMFRLSLAPYQREPMDSVKDSDVQSITLMWASQTGKTECINNIVAYFICQDPSPILCIQPTLEMADTWSKDRLAPMIRDTPQLNKTVSSTKARDSGNTLLHKRFLGGHITMAGANSPASLAARPIRVLLCDEIDRYPLSAGTEGDPISLAERRTDTFPNAVIIKTSTPTVKDVSKIETEYNNTDKREWFVPCVKCNEFLVLKWKDVVWEKDEPETAHLVCEHCKEKLSDEDRMEMVINGEWRPTAEFKGKRGYRLNGLNSLFPAKKGFDNRLHQAAAGFLDAKKRGPEGLKTFINTFLAEPWEELETTLEGHYLESRREAYKGELPDGVLVLTAGVDVQADRLEAELIGWGADEECWGIEYKIIYGDPSQPEIWKQLDKWLIERYTTDDGRELPVAACCVDSGYLTKDVYDFVKPRQPRGVYAVKGLGGFGKPLVSRPSKSSVRGVRLFSIGTDTAKDVVYGRLRIEDEGFGYCHWPFAGGYHEDYFSQLTAEKCVVKMKAGQRSRKWVLKQGTRNEALDVRIYGLSAMIILNPNFKKIASKAETAPTAVTTPTKPEPSVESGFRANTKRFSGGGGFVKGWRG